LGATDVFLGVNAVDFSGYPDCRPEFLSAFENLAQLATAAGAEEHKALRIHAPLMKLSKQGIVERGLELDVDFGLTHTCYDPVQRGPKTLACGQCDACHLRLEGFREAGIQDPVPYC
jgi:7-cyano-7-deazaguanine synthase